MADYWDSVCAVRGADHIAVPAEAGVFRKINIQALFNIAEIFFCKRIAVIFGVTCREEIAALHIGYQMHTRFLGIREYLKILYQRDVAAPDFRMP